MIIMIDDFLKNNETAKKGLKILLIGFVLLVASYLAQFVLFGTMVVDLLSDDSVNQATYAIVSYSLQIILVIGGVLIAVGILLMFISFLKELADTEIDTSEFDSRPPPKPIRYCPKCGRNIPQDAIICPYCGVDFKKQLENNK